MGWTPNDAEMFMGQQPDPGWYDDPERPGQQRWWDGHQWTDGRRASLPEAGWYDDPDDPGRQRWWDGDQWADQRRPRSPAAAPHQPYPGASAGAYNAGPAGPPVRNRIVAIVLALLVGGFGVHKFYTGNVGLGILYLVFFWTFIPAIIALIEGIVWAFQSDEEWAARQGVVHG